MCSYHRWAHIHLSWKRGEWCHLGSSIPLASHLSCHWIHWWHRWIFRCTCRNNSILSEGHTFVFDVSQSINEWNKLRVCDEQQQYVGELLYQESQVGSTIEPQAWYTLGIGHLYSIRDKERIKHYIFLSRGHCCNAVCELWYYESLIRLYIDTIYSSCIPQSPLVALLQSIHTPASAQASA